MQRWLCGVSRVVVLNMCENVKPTGAMRVGELVSRVSRLLLLKHEDRPAVHGHQKRTRRRLVVRGGHNSDEKIEKDDLPCHGETWRWVGLEWDAVRKSVMERVVVRVM